jgi:hypothetical protein
MTFMSGLMQESCILAYSGNPAGFHLDSCIPAHGAGEGAGIGKIRQNPSAGGGIWQNSDTTSLTWAGLGTMQTGLFPNGAWCYTQTRAMTTFLALVANSMPGESLERVWILVIHKERLNMAGEMSKCGVVSHWLVWAVSTTSTEF